VTTTSLATPSRGRFWAVRFAAGEDLVAGLRAFVAARHLQAAAIVTAVGSLTRVTLRAANSPTWETCEGHFEIVSLVGTIDAEGEHLHIALADHLGVTVGAHLGLGSCIHTTVEIVLVELEDYGFTREPCETSDAGDLVVLPRAAGQRIP
jgi:predicted DNA-binding protein with PD1-like motif